MINGQPDSNLDSQHNPVHEPAYSEGSISFSRIKSIGTPPLVDPLLIIMEMKKKIVLTMSDTIIFEFPIKDPREEAPMKNIYPIIST
jgi:hypothetical protein